MPKINILNILPGDSQFILVDKINYNFDQILSAGGGPQGPIGLKGSTGSIGPQGLRGPAGPQGMDGSKWYVQPNEPSTNNPFPIPFGEPQIGDYWLTDENYIPHPYGFHVYTEEGWKYTGVSLNSTQLFTAYTGINQGSNGKAIIHDDQGSNQYSLVISDYAVNGINGFKYTDHTSYAINSEKAKLKIATDPQGFSQALLSFGRANFDEGNKNDNSFSQSYNPIFRWTNPSSTNTDNAYDLELRSPRSNISIVIPQASQKTIKLDSYNVSSNASNLNSISGNSVVITRTEQSNTFRNQGDGTYFSEGSEIRFEPNWQSPSGNFIVGRNVSISGTKGLVISTNQLDNSPRYLTFKSSLSSSLIYGGIGAELQSGSSLISSIIFKNNGGTNDVSIDFATSNSSQQNNTRLTLDSEGDLTFKFGNISGPSRDVTISIQEANSTDPGANLTISAGSSDNGNYGGGNVYIGGGTGGYISGKSGSVVINPGQVENGGSSQSGGVYLHTSQSGKNNVTGVAIGLSETTNVDAALVVADINNNVSGGDILQLKKYSQRDNSEHFFGFDSDGYLTKGLPYNPVLSNGGSFGYELSGDPNNLDYYAEGDWASTLSLNFLNGTSEPNWSPGFSYKILKSRFTRIGDTVTVDFLIKIDEYSGISQTVSQAIGINPSLGHLYIEGLPYTPDFSRVNPLASSELGDPLLPAMPYYSLKARNLIGNIQVSSVPIGTIVAWSSNSTTIPSGWLLCDGTSYRKDVYGDLFSVIQGTYGVDTTNFRVPDLRGLFIRGLGGNAASIGVIQQDALIDHIHTFSVGTRDTLTTAGQGPRVNSVSNGTNVSTAPAGGANETRPRNMAMQYIIYAGQTLSQSSGNVIDIGASLVKKPDESGKLQLYTQAGNLSITSIPRTDGSSVDSYIGGSFTYFTLSSVSYVSASCNAPTGLQIRNSTTSLGTLEIKYIPGSGNPNSIVVESSPDGVSWTQLGTSYSVSVGWTNIGNIPSAETRYRVYQICTNGNSDPSNVAIYTPSPCIKGPTPIVQEYEYQFGNFGTFQIPGRVSVSWNPSLIPPTNSVSILWRKQPSTVWQTVPSPTDEFGVSVASPTSTPRILPSPNSVFPSEGTYEFILRYNCPAGGVSPDSDVATYTYTIPPPAIQTISGTAINTTNNQWVRVKINYSVAAPCAFSYTLTGSFVQSSGQSPASFNRPVNVAAGDTFSEITITARSLPPPNSGSSPIVRWLNVVNSISSAAICNGAATFTLTGI
jgi:microcystin-dependent protein